MDLSVIVPIYNAKDTVERSVLSLINQKTRFEYEIILIDDGSTDNSADIIEKFRDRKNVKIVSRNNKGIGYTRSEGLRLAEGEYISYLDSDDFLDENAVEQVLSAAREKLCDIVIFDSEFIMPDNKTKPYPALPGKERYLTSGEYLLSMPSPWNKIVKKKLFTDNGIDFPEGIWYEDFATMPALAITTDKIYYLKKTLHKYNFIGTSITRGDFFKENSKDIIPAVNLLVSRTAEKFPIETEYLAWLHFYRTFSWNFYRFARLDLIDEMTNCFLSHFPNWKKNPLIKKEKFLSRFYTFLFINKHYTVLGILKGRKK